MKRNIIAFSLLISSITMAEVYKLDSAHTTVGFTVPHLVVAKVRGRFDKFEGGFDFSSGKVSKVDVKIDLDSVNTNEAKRDAHLKGPDFFGARDAKGGLVGANQFMTFVSDGDAIKTGENTLGGKLTLNKVTKDLKLKVTYAGEATDPWGNKRVAFTANAKINRQDFGVKWNKALETGGLVVGDEVEIVIEGEAIAQASAAGKKK